jgi:hypothetical protein
MLKERPGGTKRADKARSAVLRSEALRGLSVQKASDRREEACCQPYLTNRSSMCMLAVTGSRIGGLREALWVRWEE